MSIQVHQQRLKEWVKISRVQTALVTALAIWLGYATVKPLDFSTFIILGIVGILIHIWGFMLNEVNDKEYDKEHSNEGHPLTNGYVNSSDASKVAWLCGAASLLISAFMLNTLGTILLLTSFIAGEAYNTFSKRHWWSNLYLSAWALLLSFAGAAYAGGFSIYTVALGLALSIQIFVQVIQGDMKDINSPEVTMAERAGVVCDSDNVMKYPSAFRKGINVLKAIEGALVYYVVITNINTGNTLDMVIFTLFALASAIFISTSTFYMTATLDRDKIKRRSSIHELSAILMIGISSYWLDYASAIVIALAPIVWYALFNKLLHSGTLNPDI